METIKSKTNCPTCNSECTIHGEVTHFYKPVFIAQTMIEFANWIDCSIWCKEIISDNWYNVNNTNEVITAMELLNKFLNERGHF